MSEMNKCAECGMYVDVGTYHPYAACLMYQGCHDSQKVKANLDGVIAHGAQYESGFDDLADRYAALEARCRELEEDLAEWKGAKADWESRAISYGNHANANSKRIAELEAQDEVHWKTRRTLLRRIAALEVLCREQQERMDKIRNAGLEWAMTCPCICAECDRFYESVKANAGSGLETPAKRIWCMSTKAGHEGLHEEKADCIDVFGPQTETKGDVDGR